MISIAVTGGFCSGKSKAAKYLSLKGGALIDCDRIVNEELYVLPEVLEHVSDILGPEALLDDGTLNRRKVAQIIFSDAGKKRALEQYLHPLVYERVDGRLEKLELKGDVEFAVVEVPLLAESGAQADFDAVILIACNRQFQLDRARGRGYAKRLAEKFVDSQFSWEEKLKVADYIVYNNSLPEEMFLRLDEILRALLCQDDPA